jgi:hypothetical protein
MMKRSLFCLFLFCAPLAEAGPKHWIQHHPKTSKLIAAGIAAGVHAYGLHHCRQINVELCDGKYGAAWGIFAATTAGNLAMIPVSEKIGGIQGDAFSYGWSAAQLGHGIVQWRKNEPAKVDLSHVAILCSGAAVRWNGIGETKD